MSSRDWNEKVSSHRQGECASLYKDSYVAHAFLRSRDYVCLCNGAKELPGEEEICVEAPADSSVAGKLKPGEVLKQVMQSSRFQNMKRIMKHKCFREGCELLRVLCSFAHRILTRESKVSDRQKNLLLRGDTPDTGIGELVCSTKNLNIRKSRDRTPPQLCFKNSHS